MLGVESGRSVQNNRLRRCRIRGVFLAWLVLAATSGGRSSAAINPTTYSSVAVPAGSTGPLLQAYTAYSGGKPAAEAPFVLERDVVEIVNRSSEVGISFLPNLVKGATNVTVERGGAAVVRDTPMVLDERPILLPGVTAGALIAAYAASLARNDITTRDSSESGFRVEILAGAGGALISFIPQKSAIMPGSTCIAGNCDARSNYLVRLESGRAIVTYRSG
jgi:hypothetical protein